MKANCLLFSLLFKLSFSLLLGDAGLPLCLLLELGRLDFLSQKFKFYAGAVQLLGQLEQLPLLLLGFAVEEFLFGAAALHEVVDLGLLLQDDPPHALRLLGKLG